MSAFGRYWLQEEDGPGWFGFADSDDTAELLAKVDQLQDGLRWQIVDTKDWAPGKQPALVTGGTAGQPLSLPTWLDDGAAEPPLGLVDRIVTTVLGGLLALVGAVGFLIAHRYARSTR